MGIKIISVQGEKALEYIPELARLRINVFREYPYLYDGNLEYEENYLSTYIKSSRSVIVLALHDDKVIGASTALPLSDETPEFTQPFVAKGYDIKRIFYFGESVLDVEFRGQGIGVAFFKAREEHAKRVGGYNLFCFCAVERDVRHGHRPDDYRPLDQFWKNRGFVKRPELSTRFRWKDINEAKASDKTMVFWTKDA